MKKLTELSSWQALTTHKNEVDALHLQKLFQHNPNRFNQFSINGAELIFDFSKNLINEKTLELFSRLADECRLSNHIEDMFNGHAINTSEQRPALHTALRNQSKQPILVDGKDIMPLIHETLIKMETFADEIRNGTRRGFSNKPFTDIVNIGIGGSDLGPTLAVDALSPYADKQLQFHFVSNVDGSLIDRVLKKLNPETTLFIVSSKSFSTIETLVNARTALKWFTQKVNENQAFKKHFIAITSKSSKAVEFGIDPENIFPLWDWVGGRYSLWSAIGLPIALAVGAKHFRQMLQGANEADQHFRNTAFSQNAAVIMGLLSIWYMNFFGAQSHAILPYNELLKQLPAYLQQTQMESHGKQVKLDGSKVDYQTSQIIFGHVGTTGQHSIHQLLHQGTQFLSCDFIVPLTNHHALNDHQAILVANALSQTKALMEGKSLETIKQEMLKAGCSNEQIQALAPHKVVTGNRPSTTILLPKLTPATFGALLAFYEHKVFVQSVIWQINAFDQWGVELGKQLADILLPQLMQQPENLAHDSSTNGLIKHYHMAISKNR